MNDGLYTSNKPLLIAAAVVVAIPSFLGLITGQWLFVLFMVGFVGPLLVGWILLLELVSGRLLDRLDRRFKR